MNIFDSTVTEPKWHNLTYQETMRLWGDHMWWSETETTLRYIATCEDAKPEDRLNALSTLSWVVSSTGVTPEVYLPEFMLKVMLDILKGPEKQSWWSRLGSKRRARRASDRLVAAIYMVKLAVALTPSPSATKATVFSDLFS